MENGRCNRRWCGSRRGICNIKRRESKKTTALFGITDNENYYLEVKSYNSKKKIYDPELLSFRNKK